MTWFTPYEYTKRYKSDNVWWPVINEASSLVGRWGKIGCEKMESEDLCENRRMNNKEKASVMDILVFALTSILMRFILANLDMRSILND